MLTALLFVAASAAPIWLESVNAGSPAVRVMDIDMTLAGSKVYDWNPGSATGFHAHLLGTFKGTLAEMNQLKKDWLTAYPPYPVGHEGVWLTLGPNVCAGFPCNQYTSRTVTLSFDSNEWIGNQELEIGFTCLPIVAGESIPETSWGQFNCRDQWVEFMIQTQ